MSVTTLNSFSNNTDVIYLDFHLQWQNPNKPDIWRGYTSSFPVSIKEIDIDLKSTDFTKQTGKLSKSFYISSYDGVIRLETLLNVLELKRSTFTGEFKEYNTCYMEHIDLFHNQHELMQHLNKLGVSVDLSSIGGF